jgi:hypothetical protein
MIEIVSLDQAFLDVAKYIFDELGKQLKDLSRELLDKAMEEVFGVLMDTISDTPVVGWVVNMVMALPKIIKSIREINKLAAQEHARLEIKPAEFSPEFDNQAANHVIWTMADTVDWTDLFLPPGYGSASQWQHNFVAFPLVGGGYKYQSANIQSDPNTGQLWLGFIPGTNAITRKYEIRNVGTTRWLDTGKYLPSARGMGTTSWGMVTKNSPSTYCVNAERCRTHWYTYLGTLRDSIQGSDLFNKESKRRFVDEMNNQGVHWLPYHPDDVIGDWKGYGVDGSRPMLELQKLKEAQESFLHTLTVAYVSLDFAAFHDNAHLQGLWRTNIRKLFEHPAKCLVDLDNVVDPEVKAELIARGVGTPSCAPTQRLLAQAERKEGLYIAKTAKPPKFYQGAVRRGERGGGGLALAAAGLAALALWISTRKK